jgi:hypothetical protein
MKLFHNKLLGKILAVLFGLAAALYFAWTFSYFGLWLGERFQGVFPEAPTIVGMICGFVMFLAVLYSYFYIEYAKEDVRAYELDRGDGTFLRALRQLKWGVLALEVFSLLFRLFQLGFAPIGFAMVGIGLALLWLAHLFGKVLHAQVNVPHDVEAGRTMEEAGRQVWQAAPRLMKRMSHEQLRRLASGDPQPLDEVNDQLAREREREVSNAERCAREDQERRERARTMNSRYLAPHRHDDPVEKMPATNGASPHF